MAILKICLNKGVFKINYRTKDLVTVAIFAVLSFLIMLFEISLPLMPHFLKLDFSEIAGLIIGLVYTPLMGVGVVLVKNLIRLTMTTTFGIGELTNFIVGASLVFSTALAYHKFKLNLLKSLFVGVITMTIGSIFINLIFVIPIYEAILKIPLTGMIDMASEVNPLVNDLKSYLIFVIGPFNLIKATVTASITYLLYPKIKNYLTAYN